MRDPEQTAAAAARTPAAVFAFEIDEERKKWNE